VATPAQQELADPDILFSGASVLVVEDSDVNCEVATALLEMMGCEVSVAKSGRAAIESCRKRRFDVVLLDVQMPEMDGYILTRNIKSDPRFRGVPVLMHSSLSSDSNRQLGISVGVDEYIPKFEPRKLAETVGRLLSRRA
jgi:two-component system chemotaxis response regulator CheV